MLKKQNPPPQNTLLDRLKSPEITQKLIPEILDKLGRSRFFGDFTSEDVKQLYPFMPLYLADPGETLMQEGETDDFMMFIIEGRVKIVKTDTRGENRPMGTIGPGGSLGEMSMIDGEPRFATCIVSEPTMFAVLSRDSMSRIMEEAPELGAKILLQMVMLLSKRLRTISGDLLHHLENTFV